MSLLRVLKTGFFSTVILFLTVANIAIGQEGNYLNLTIDRFLFEANDGKQIEVDKGRLMVPENRTKTDSRMIPINFIRFKSTSSHPSTPIVYLAAGPGAAGISIAKRNLDFFLNLTQAADVIVFDQRGTGDEAMPCPTSIALPYDRSLQYEEVLEIVSEKSLFCKTHWQDKGYDLAGYTTAESAHDVDELRKALDIEKISLLGSSYGSHYALAIMKLHEDIVDRVAVAGVEGLDNTLKLPSYYDDHFDDINELLQQDPELSAKIPDLELMFRGILDELDSEPQIVTITDRQSGEDIDVHLGRFEVQLLVWGATGRNDASAKIPAMIYEMYRGNFDALANRIHGFKTRALRLSAMTVMMDGASGASPTRLKQIANEVDASIFGNVVNFLFPEIGHAWAVPDLGASFRSQLISDIPTLIISGTMDARTPIINGELLASGLTNSQHLIMRNVGHPPPFEHIEQDLINFFQGEKLSNLSFEGPKVEFAPIN